MYEDPESDLAGVTQLKMDIIDDRDSRGNEIVWPCGIVLEMKARITLKPDKVILNISKVDGR